MRNRYLLFAVGFVLLATLTVHAQDNIQSKKQNKVDVRPPERGSSPWGKDDQRGALNLLTPAKTLGASRLIKTGTTYPLGRMLEEGMPMVSGRQYSMIIPQAAAPAGENRIIGNEEFITGQLGQVGTGLDGLGHIGVGDIFYNGHNRRDFVTPKGLKSLGIENAGPIFTRGILLDIAALKHVRSLDASYEVTRRDLEDALRSEKLSIEPGDAVLIHTGWGRHWLVDNATYSATEPGIGWDAGKFLIERKICLVGSDNWGVEVAPNPDRRFMYPVHQLLVSSNGVYILENIDTAKLAKDKVYEFAFILSPLPIKGGTGSPVNPIAVR